MMRRKKMKMILRIPMGIIKENNINNCKGISQWKIKNKHKILKDISSVLKREQINRLRPSVTAVMLKKIYSFILVPLNNNSRKTRIW